MTQLVITLDSLAKTSITFLGEREKGRKKEEERNKERKRERKKD